MRLAIALACGGCWTVAPTQPVMPPSASTIGEHVDRAGDPSWEHRGGAAQIRRTARFPLHSVWEGTYRCAQGLSAVRLTIDAQTDGEATAVYEFGGVPSNPTVPSGSFRLTGKVVGTSEHFQADFEAAEWIVHPPSYFMVGVSVETRDPRTLTGTIRHPSCSDFEATRAD